jgi:cytochrome oxidase Cu insertion factor (SCO1/SenC/PrrC family)
MSDGRAWMRNPFLWAFVLGVVTLTLLRPVMRREPPPLPRIRPAPGFLLTDPQGHGFSSTELVGKVWVIGFLSGSCTSSCLALLEATNRLQQRYAATGVRGVQLVTVSLDDAPEAPERLRLRAARSGQVSDDWVFLGGDPSQVRRLVQEGFSLPLGHDKVTPTGGVVAAHAAQLALIDRQGWIRAYVEVGERDDRYPGLSDPIDVAVDELFHRSRQLLGE